MVVIAPSSLDPRPRVSAASSWSAGPNTEPTTVGRLTAPPADLARLRLELLVILDEIEHEIMYAYVHKRIYTELRDE